MTTPATFRPTALIADALSLANAACGVVAIGAALRGRPDVALLFILLAAACDAFDGAAARRFGATPWGVWSDDVADALSYGVAPAFVIAAALPGVVGVVLGVAYALFVFARLAYFTAMKGTADPAYFAGMPSPVGGVIVAAAAVALPRQPALFGLFVGVACMQMVSFSASFRHLGRLVLARRRYAASAATFVAMLAVVALVVGPVASAAALLVTVVAYALGPTFAAAHRAFSRRGGVP